MIKIILLLLITGIGLIVVHPVFIPLQSAPQLQLNQVIQDVLKAESAGATPEEMERLAGEMNSVINLEDQLQSLSAQEAVKRSQLLGEIKTTMARVDADAKEVEITASQRTFTYRIVTYSLGALGAVLTTVVSHFTISLWRKYRVKRVLQLRIVPK
jgi:hypothetical protein